MGALQNGVIVAVLTLLTIAACVTVMVPSIHWARAEYHGSSLEVSLWEICTPQNCTKIGHDIKSFANITHDFKTNKDAERDGAVAGLALATVFALLTYFFLCCKSKAFIIVFQLLATACVMATMFCMYEYKTNTLDKDLKNLGAEHGYDYTTGFWITLIALLLSFFSFVTSWCLNFHAAYENLSFV